MTVRLLIFLLLSVEVLSIWPPPHEIKLDDSETFIISEFSESDDLFSDEDEMIPVKSSPDKKKYFRLHEIVRKLNKREWGDETIPRNLTKMKEHNFDLDDPMPWEGGFVNKEGEFIHPDGGEKVFYLNEMAKDLIDNKIEQKREDHLEAETERDVENYDYKNFKAEYQSELEKSKMDKDTLNYTEVKEDESLKDAVEAVVSFKEATNCSAEEAKGIGFAAIKCLVTDIQTTKNQNSILNLLEKIARIALIWFLVYLVIAIPCWCSRGWCCCCCCCKICRPRETIDDAKRFFTQNPVGTFHTKDGEKVEYPPTNYEIYTQKSLEKALFSL